MQIENLIIAFAFYKGPEIFIFQLFMSLYLVFHKMC